MSRVGSRIGIRLNGETLWNQNFVENAHNTSLTENTLAITQGVPSGENGSERNGLASVRLPIISENKRKGKRIWKLK